MPYLPHFWVQHALQMFACKGCLGSQLITAWPKGAVGPLSLVLGPETRRDGRFIGVLVFFSPDSVLLFSFPFRLRDALGVTTSSTFCAFFFVCLSLPFASFDFFGVSGLLFGFLPGFAFAFPFACAFPFAFALGFDSFRPCCCILVVACRAKRCTRTPGSNTKWTSTFFFSKAFKQKENPARV